MPFDSLTYRLLAKELDKTLSGGRIERVCMPSKEDVVLNVRTLSRESRRLLISANPSAPRIYLTEQAAENPLNAFSFLMHLRKRLGGGTIKGVKSALRERIIMIEIAATDDLGYARGFTLTAELLGRYANVVLTDERGVVTDCLRHISLDEFSARALLPGIPYSLPPLQQDKISPDEREGLAALLDEFGGGDLGSFLSRGVYGYAPNTLKEIAYLAYGTVSPDRETVAKNPEKVTEAIARADQKAEPCAIVTDGKVREVFAFPYAHIGEEYTKFSSLSEAAERYFADKSSAVNHSGARAMLETAVKNALKKNAKGMAAMREKLLACQDADEDRVAGELVTANIYRIKTGMTEAVVDDYYTGKTRVIALDPTLSPQANAQKYFKAYNKKKRSTEKTAEQIALSEEREDYYESLAASIERAETEADLEEIKAEMERAGLIKAAKRKQKIKPSAPIMISEGGYKVVIGKNNTQNDAIVRGADGGWLWLHAQKIHGSHGVIMGKDIPQNVINAVAAYVAHYSKAAMSANVPVDYTLVKYVKKPSGAAPGKVVYTHQQTVNVAPKKPQQS